MGIFAAHRGEGSDCKILCICGDIVGSEQGDTSEDVIRNTRCARRLAHSRVAKAMAYSIPWLRR